jgi:putative tryptophan/tyrosine transport system substrate-binding protein
MKRRQFITLLGGAAVTWPLAAHAQQPTKPVIGFLHSGQPVPFAPMVAAFREGLSGTGYVEVRNVTIEYRWAEGNYDRLPELANDLVRRGVAVIATAGGLGPAIAAKRATTTIPIVFTGGGDPVELGLVASFNRPGGNATGFSNVSITMEAKRLEILRELVPTARLVGYLTNPSRREAENQVKEVQDAARSVGQEIFVVNVSSEREFEAAFAALVERRAGALHVATDPFFNSRRDQIIALAARHKIPAMFAFREYAVAGGLVTYGAVIAEGYTQIGMYTGQILKGAKPADLPVLQPTKFELVINAKTAKALGLEVPHALLARADEVIE